MITVVNSYDELMRNITTIINYDIMTYLVIVTVIIMINSVNDNGDDDNDKRYYYYYWCHLFITELALILNKFCSFCCYYNNSYYYYMYFLFVYFYSYSVRITHTAAVHLIAGCWFLLGARNQVRVAKTRETSFKQIFSPLLLVFGTCIVHCRF